MEKEKRLKTMIVVLIILLLLTISLCAYLLIQRVHDVKKVDKEQEQIQENVNKDKEKDESNDKKNDKEEETDKENESSKLTVEEMNALYESTQTLSHYFTRNNFYFYGIEGKVKASEISDDVKVILAIGAIMREEKNINIGKEDIKDENLIFSKEKIREKVRLLFGKNVTFNDIETAIQCRMLTYDQNNYYLSKVIGCGGLMHSLYTKVISMAEQNNIVTIDVKYMFLSFINNESVELYEEVEIENNVFKNIDFKKSLGILPMETKVSIDDYLSVLNTLRYTFVKEDGHYILESVENIKNS